MAFSLETLNDLDYDFTSIPHNDGKKNHFCSGKGTVPEPTQKQLEAYAEGFKKMLGEDLTDAQVEDRTYALIAALCQNSPSKAELKELPPRGLMGFTRWINSEVANPEV